MDMHHIAIVQKTLSPVIHTKRLNCLSEVVSSAFVAESLTVTQLGRALPNSFTEKNGIKKADRLLSNTKLHDEYPIICNRLCTSLIADHSVPWVLVDWTKMPHKNFHVIRASLVADGRAITLYEEIHDEKKLGSPKVHKKFLQELKRILPQTCNPIIVTDAGFGVSWFKSVLKQSWNYASRVRGNSYYSKYPDMWLKCSNLKDMATKTPKYIGAISLTKKHSFQTNLYTMKDTPKGRHSLNKAGKIRKDSNSKSKSRAAIEPLAIVTSLTHSSTMANKVIKIYQTRMQIEEAIRDLKSTKYGFGFEHMLSYKPKRILMLLLIAMIAALIAYITGLIAEDKNLQYQFQANTIKNRRVLSLFYLGRRIIKKQFQINYNNILEENCYYLTQNIDIGDI